MHTRNFRKNTSQQAARLASFRDQMADFARGELLRELREARHLSQEDAAHEIGVTTKTIRSWEKGGGIRWHNARSAGRVYEVDPDSLVRREGRPDGPVLTLTAEAGKQGDDQSLPYKTVDVERAIRMEMKLDALLNHFDVEYITPEAATKPKKRRPKK